MKHIIFRTFFVFSLAIASAQAIPLDDAIVQSAKKIENGLERGTRVAILNCKSSSAKLSSYVVQETVFALVNAGKLVIVEREDIQSIKDELQFQISGDVSDESAQSIGKFLGAQVIVTCTLDDTLVLRMKAIEVETARLMAVSSVTVQKTDLFDSLAQNVVLVVECASAVSEKSLASAVSGLMISAVSGTSLFRVVSEESRTKAVRESGLASADMSDEKTRVRLAKLTEASSILSGRLSLEGGLLFLTITHLDVESGLILSSSTETYRSSGTLLEGATGQVLRCLGIDTALDDRRVISVTNMTELLQAIGNDRIIKLAPGVYDLSPGYQVKNKYISWIDEYDGPYPVIKSVSNLALIADGNATIMIKPAYGWVLSFDTCSTIRITGVVFGHSVPGYCLGGVLRFRNCDDVEVRSCELYGSGTYGLSLERVSGFSMADSIIRDCTYGLATIERSGDISFTNTVFRDTGEFDLIGIDASDNITWTDCRFEENWGTSLFSVDDESRGLSLVRCVFANNDIKTFCFGGGSLSVESPVYKNNGFKPYRK